MINSLKGRSLLKLTDFTAEEVNLIIETAKQFKLEKKIGQPHQLHKGKNVALLFEKTSTRTRCAFTVAANDLGVNPEFLGKDDIQLGKKESVEDTAKTLGRMFDGIEFRGYSQNTVEQLAKFSGVPVWNGLTDKFHPTQVLADFMTLEEKIGGLKGLKLVFVGNGQDNMSNSLLLDSALMGLDFRILTPVQLKPADDILAEAKQLAVVSGAKITVTSDFNEALKGADAVYTDVWVSMGEESKFAERISLLKNYQVNSDLLKLTENPNVIFMHCLPAFHNLETDTAKQIHDQFGLSEMEVTNEVFNGPSSVVFDEAENRMHTIKAVMALTL